MQNETLGWRTTTQMVRFDAFARWELPPADWNLHGFAGHFVRPPVSSEKIQMWHGRCF
jgi:hypothetical protein